MPGDRGDCWGAPGGSSTLTLAHHQLERFITDLKHNPRLTHSSFFPLCNTWEV